MMNISNGQESLKIRYKSSVLESLNIADITDEGFTEENLLIENFISFLGYIINII